MEALVTLPAADGALGAPYEVSRPPGDRAGPLIFASPHSGRLYPPEMMAASSLDAGLHGRQSRAL